MKLMTSSIKYLVPYLNEDALEAQSPLSKRVMDSILNLSATCKLREFDLTNNDLPVMDLLDAVRSFLHWNTEFLLCNPNEIKGTTYACFRTAVDQSFAKVRRALKANGDLSASRAVLDIVRATDRMTSSLVEFFDSGAFPACFVVSGCALAYVMRYTLTVREWKDFLGVVDDSSRRLLIEGPYCVPDVEGMAALIRGLDYVS